MSLRSWGVVGSGDIWIRTGSLPVGGSDGGKEAGVSQARKRAWRRMVAGLFMLPAMGVTGASLWAQTSPMSPAQLAVQPAMDKAKAQEYVKEGRRCLQS